MKIPMTWLKESVRIPWSTKELANRLTMAGLEVEALSGGGDQAILEITITPNRGDCLSVVGVAREVSALQGRALPFKKTPPPKGKGPSREILQVQVIAQKAAPRYMARAIFGVKIQPSPPWMQKRLTEVGIRPINNVVDCTNYVLWELGHPLHAFDYRLLRDHKIIVRCESNTYKFTTLDGEQRVCEPTDLFICDGKGPVALAGIMGGANSEVKPDTQDIVIEAAYFEPKGIHTTAKCLNLTTESSYRFERGVDPNGVGNALHRVVQLILQTAGGVPTQDWIDIYPKKILSQQLSLTAQEVERILGIKIPLAKIQAIIKGLGLVSKKIGTKLQVTIPTFRGDISRPIDLIEEIARIYGYDRIPETKPQIKVVYQTSSPTRQVLQQVSQLLVGQGFTQGCHLAFTSFAEAKQFAAHPETIVSLSNPLSQDQACLRPALVPALLKAAAFNANRQRNSLKLFEIGKVFAWIDGKVGEERHLGLVAYGLEFPIQWQLKNKAVDFYSLKGVVTALSKQFGLADLGFQTEAIPPFLVPNHSATLWWQGEKMGWLGLVNPTFLLTLDIKVPIYVCELTIDNIITNYKNIIKKFNSIAKWPYSERDLALVVDQGLPAGKIIQAIHATHHPWIQDIQFFDQYWGTELGPNNKSIALRIQYAAKTRTLTNEEVNQAHQSLVDQLTKTLPAKLR